MIKNMCIGSFVFFFALCNAGENKKDNLETPKASFSKILSIVCDLRKPKKSRSAVTPLSHVHRDKNNEIDVAFLRFLKKCKEEKKKERMILRFTKKKEAIIRRDFEKNSLDELYNPNVFFTHRPGQAS